MTRAEHLLEVARQLMAPLQTGSGSNEALCRSISTSYYAAFSALSDLIADTFFEDRQSSAWRRVFRGLNHGSFKKAKGSLSRLPKTPSTDNIAFILETMISLHDRRQQADYDPHYVASLGSANEAYMDAWVIVTSVKTIAKDDPVAGSELVSLCLFPVDRL